MISIYFFLICLLETPVKGVDYCKFCNGRHTMCLYPRGPSRKCINHHRVVFPPQMIKYIVDVHNDIRNHVASGREYRGTLGGQPPASNMFPLLWNQELSEIAQRWADQCVQLEDPTQHDSCKRTDLFEVAQNILTVVSADPQSPDLAVLILNWYKQVLNVIPTDVDQFLGEKRGKYVIGQYSQLLWANTKYVGCAMARYKNLKANTDSEKYLHRFVCNYGPRGNVIGERIYKVGEPCSDCPDKKCDEVRIHLCKVVEREIRSKAVEKDYTEDELYQLEDEEATDNSTGDGDPTISNNSTIESLSRKVSAEKSISLSTEESITESTAYTKDTVQIKAAPSTDPIILDRILYKEKSLSDYSRDEDSDSYLPSVEENEIEGVSGKSSQEGFQKIRDSFEGPVKKVDSRGSLEIGEPEPFQNSIEEDSKPGALPESFEESDTTIIEWNEEDLATTEQAMIYNRNNEQIPGSDISDESEEVSSDSRQSNMTSENEESYENLNIEIDDSRSSESERPEESDSNTESRSYESEESTVKEILIEPQSIQKNVKISSNDAETEKQITPTTEPATEQTSETSESPKPNDSLKPTLVKPREGGGDCQCSFTLPERNSLLEDLLKLITG